MSEFIDAALGFPTALFSFSLLVVAAYWGLVLLGGLGIDVLDADADPGAGVGAEDGAFAGMDGGLDDAGDLGDAGDAGGFGGFLGASGLGGAPVTVVLSLLISVAWFVSLAGSVLLRGLGGGAPARAALSLAVLAAAVLAAWLCTRVLVLPLRQIFRAAVQPSRRDFVGRVCVIRTGRVGTDFGQAEVTASDGSAALIQVRRPGGDIPVAGKAGGDTLTAGRPALIFDYDSAGEFFLVMPYDQALDPDGFAG